MKKKILGYLLHLANRDIPFLHKSDFYMLKQNLLDKHGNFVGMEIQHIKKECFSCENGVYISDYKEDEECFKCGGTGVYEEFWSRLLKYELGGYYFHRPIEKMTNYDPLFEGISLPIIEGYIHHKSPKFRVGTEACMWLFLIYDRFAFKRIFGHYGFPNGKRTPLVFLANLYWHLRNFDWNIILNPRIIIRRKYNDDNLPF